MVPNCKAWLFEAKNNIMGKLYCDQMIMGWNNGLSDLMKIKPEDGEAATPAVAAASMAKVESSCVVDFLFKGRTPFTQDVFMKLLCSNEVCEMIRSRKYAQVFVLVYKWWYYLKMEGCSSNWGQ